MNAKIFPFIIALIFLTACQSVRVVTDYDKVAPFKSYKTFGFHKEGVDRS